MQQPYELHALLERLRRAVGQGVQRIGKGQELRLPLAAPFMCGEPAGVGVAGKEGRRAAGDDQRRGIKLALLVSLRSLQTRGDLSDQHVEAAIHDRSIVIVQMIPREPRQRVDRRLCLAVVDLEAALQLAPDLIRLEQRLVRIPAAELRLDGLQVLIADIRVVVDAAHQRPAALLFGEFILKGLDLHALKPAGLLSGALLFQKRRDHALRLFQLRVIRGRVRHGAERRHRADDQLDRVDLERRMLQDPGFRLGPAQLDRLALGLPEALIGQLIE